MVKFLVLLARWRMKVRTELLAFVPVAILFFTFAAVAGNTRPWRTIVWDLKTIPVGYHFVPLEQCFRLHPAMADGSHISSATQTFDQIAIIYDSSLRPAGCIQAQKDMERMNIRYAFRE